MDLFEKCSGYTAAKEAMAAFIAGKRLSANQIEFINLIVDHLT